MDELPIARYLRRAFFVILGQIVIRSGYMTKAWGENPKTFELTRRASGNPFSLRDPDGDGVNEGVEGLTGFTAESGFSVSDNEDGTWTITDGSSRFGTKPNGSKPLYYIPFGEGTDQPDASWSRKTHAITWEAHVGLTHVDARTGSTHSMMVESAASDSYTVAINKSNFDVSGNTGRKYYRCLIYKNGWTPTVFDPYPSAPNQKHQRWGYGTNSEPYTGPNLQGGSFRYNFAFDSGGVSTSEMFLLGDFSTQKYWHEEEYHRTSSSAGATDAVMYGVLDGKQKFVRDNVDSHNGFDPTTYQWQYFKFMEWAYWAAPGEAPWYCDLWYIDDSWCQIFITDQSTWDETVEHQREIQIPTSWAAGSITLGHRQGALSSLSGKTLWVRKDDGAVLKIGSWA